MEELVPAPRGGLSCTEMGVSDAAAAWGRGEGNRCLGTQSKQKRRMQAAAGFPRDGDLGRPRGLCQPLGPDRGVL